VKEASLIINPRKLQDMVAKLEAQTLADGFWDANKKAQHVMSKISMCKEDISTMKQWNGRLADAEVALEFATQEEGVRIAGSLGSEKRANFILVL
jgi:hypothetical protein